jgi:hypothetical protein
MTQKESKDIPKGLVIALQYTIILVSIMTYYIADVVECGGAPYFEYRCVPEPIDEEIQLITIEFRPPTQPFGNYCYSQPQFVFLDVVVLRDKWEYCQMHQLDVNSELDFFRIVGMKLVESRLRTGRLTEAPYWLYEIECLTSPSQAIWISEEELIAQRDLEPSLSEF